MRTFSCTCGNPVYFWNSLCERCGHQLGFLPDRLIVGAVAPAGDDHFRVLPTGTDHGDAESDDRRYRQCDNYRFEQVCNWLIEPGDDASFCRACRLNHLIPDLSVAENRSRWARVEEAKRRLLYTLYRLRLPLDGRTEDPERGLSFDLLADPAVGQKVYTGHDDGLITINVAEADDSSREAVRDSLGERYRTLLGHFRHEIGHYFWDRLIDGTPWLAEFRELFGDDRADYEQSLQRYYDAGAAPDWPARFVTAYSSLHPWEDWAESWAHYLHLVDTLETAADHRLAVGETRVRMPPLLLPRPASEQRAAFDHQLVDWGELALVTNAINRSMGMPDPYPFVLGQVVLEKLYFVHQVIAAAQSPALR